MVKNLILEKMQNNEKVFGTFVELNDTLIVEALSVAGFDFFIVDGEHSVTTVDNLKEIAQAADYRGITPLFRVPEITRANILQPLDIGMQGLVIPNIRSVEEVEQIVNWSKYPSLGERGFFTSRVTDFGHHESLSDLDQLFENTNNQTLIIPQCETVESLEQIEEIAAIEGVAGIFVGPFDLSIALGIPTQFDHPEFKKALERIYKAARDNNKFAMIFGMDTDIAQSYLDSGFDGLAYSMDIGFMIDAAKSVLRTLKSNE